MRSCNRQPYSGNGHSSGPIEAGLTAVTWNARGLLRSARASGDRAGRYQHQWGLLQRLLANNVLFVQETHGTAEAVLEAAMRSNKDFLAAASGFSQHAS